VRSTQGNDKKKQNDGMKVVASNVAKHDCDVDLTVYSKFINLQKQQGCNTLISLHFHFHPFVERSGISKDGVLRKSVAGAEGYPAQTVPVRTFYILKSHGN
jgi:hypothetical protein